MNNPKRFIDRFKLLLFVVAFSAASLGGGRAYAWNHLTPLTNQVVCPGETVTFKTTPSGPTPYKFWWWHDGVLQGSHTDVRNLYNFDMFQFSPTWGGNSGARKRETDHYWYDHVHLSSR